jgi:hypothetical protein
MADVKFSELSSLSTVASADVLAIVDTSESASKKLTIDNLFGTVPVNLAVTDLTQSTSNTTGSITTTGGIGVSKAAYVGGNLNVFGDADIDGTTNLDAVDIDGTVQIDAAVTVGVNDTGQDVIFYGDAAGAMAMWDTSEDSLLVRGATADAAGSSGRLVLQTAQVSVEDGDILGRIDFQAPLETQGSDGILVPASIWAEADATFTASVNNTELVFGTATTTVAAEKMRLDSSGQLGIGTATPASLLHVAGTVQVGVDDTGHDVQIFGDTASSVLLWDTSDNALEFGNSFITMTDARTTGTMDVRGITIDISNKLDTGSGNDRIGIDCDVIGDVNGYTIRDAVAIRAVSRQSTGAEVTRLNTPIHAVLDMANTASANNTGTTLSGAYGLAIDHDDTIATRTGQPTAFISFGELYIGGTGTIETKYLFDIFPEGKSGDATYGTSTDVAFYNAGAQYATTKDVMILNSTDGAPATDAGYQLLMENDPYDSIQMEDNSMIETEDGEAILLEVQDNVGTATTILFETGSQDADGVLKIRVNGEDKYLQLYDAPGEGGTSY